MQIKYYVVLTFLAAVWGASFIFMRIGSPEFGPIPLIFLRTLIAGVTLLPFIFYQRTFYRLIENWKMLTGLGVLGTAIPFSLISFTTLYLSSGVTSVLNASTPFFGAFVAYWLLKEKFTFNTAIGLALGFFGVFVLALDSLNNNSTWPLLPVISVLIATFCYALASTLSKLKIAHLTALEITAGSQLFSSLVLLPVAAVIWPNDTPSSLAWTSVISLGVFCTAIPLVIFFKLIHRIGVTKTLTVTYLIPVFGILWGVIFIDEHVNWYLGAGAALILLGVAFVTRKD